MEKNNLIITKSGARVFKDYKDNICCEDKDNKALTDKAKIKREKYEKGEAKGLCRFGSVSSEDALSWSVFRTLELKNKMDIFYNLIGINDNLVKTIFWSRDTSSGRNDVLLQRVLDEIEPRHLWKIQQTEPDVVLVGERTIIFNESKLGKPNEKILGWARRKKFEKKHDRYKSYLKDIFTENFNDNFDNFGVNFYQLMRNIIISRHYAEKLGKEFHLSVVVNELNTTEHYSSHKEKFNEFSSYVIDKNRLHFTSWQIIQQEISKDPTLVKLNDYLISHSLLHKE